MSSVSKTPLQEGYAYPTIISIFESQNIHCATYSHYADSDALLALYARFLCPLPKMVYDLALPYGLSYRLSSAQQFWL
jgi:hypothetical protein